MVDCDRYEDEARQEACRMGAENGEMAVEASPEGESANEIFFGLQDGFTQSAQYANNTLPKLRRLAGCEDPHGAGTYTQCDEEAHFEKEELVDIYWESAGEAINERAPRE